MNNQEGFTLIEIIIVIVILGILSAYAIPKYMSIDREARVSVVSSLRGSIMAAADMVHAVSTAKGITGPANVAINPGTNVSVGAGLYPTPDAAGIGQVIRDMSGFTATYLGNTATFTKDGAPTPATCSVVYDTTTANNPSITSTETGC